MTHYQVNLIYDDVIFNLDSYSYFNVVVNDVYKFSYRRGSKMFIGIAEQINKIEISGVYYIDIPIKPKIQYVVISNDDDCLIFPCDDFLSKKPMVLYPYDGVNISDKKSNEKFNFTGKNHIPFTMPKSFIYHYLTYFCSSASQLFSFLFFVLYNTIFIPYYFFIKYNTFDDFSKITKFPLQYSDWNSDLQFGLRRSHTFKMNLLKKISENLFEVDLSFMKKSVFPSPRCIFQWNGEYLIPVKIIIDAKAYFPSDGVKWTFAKLHVDTAETVYNMVRHCLLIHYFNSYVIASSIMTLPITHPTYQFIKQFSRKAFFGTFNYYLFVEKNIFRFFYDIDNVVRIVNENITYEFDHIECIKSRGLPSNMPFVKDIYFINKEMHKFVKSKVKESKEFAAALKRISDKPQIDLLVYFMTNIFIHSAEHLKGHVLTASIYPIKGKIDEATSEKYIIDNIAPVWKYYYLDNYITYGKMNIWEGREKTNFFSSNAAKDKVLGEEFVRLRELFRNYLWHTDGFDYYNVCNSIAI